MNDATDRAPIVVSAFPNTGVWSGGVIAWTLVALGCVAVGVWRTYSYPDGSGAVGGDAYNLQINALRGLVWVGAGVVAALFAVVSATGWAGRASRGARP